MRRSLLVFALAALVPLAAEEYGVPKGSKMPAFELPDQNGKPHTLQSILGPNGAMLVFFRSADW